MSRSGADFIFGACERGMEVREGVTSKSRVWPPSLPSLPAPTLFSLFGGNVKITTVAPALSDRQGRYGFLQVALVSTPVFLVSKAYGADNLGFVKT